MLKNIKLDSIFALSSKERDQKFLSLQRSILHLRKAAECTGQNIWITITRSSIIRIVVVGDLSRGWPEGSFSIATTLRCWGGRYFYSWIAPLYPWYVPYIAESRNRFSLVLCQTEWSLVSDHITCLK